MAKMADGGKPQGENRDRPDVPIRPPFILLGFLAAGGAMEFFWPLWQGGGLWAVAAGAALLACGVWLMMEAMRHFREAGTNVPTTMAAKTLVMSGPYARSRNPIYAAGLLIFLGIALLSANLWLLLLFLPFFMVLNIFVIEREEEYLARKFGPDYHEYCKLVRRWV